MSIWHWSWSVFSKYNQSGIETNVQFYFIKGHRSQTQNVNETHKWYTIDHDAFAVLSESRNLWFVYRRMRDNTSENAKSISTKIDILGLNLCKQICTCIIVCLENI